MVDQALSAKIETSRLKLRAPRRTDAPRLAALANDLDIARMTARIPHPYGLDDAHAFLDHLEGADGERHASFALEHEGEMIGMLGFHPMDDGRCELGYWLGRDWRGRGLATEAVRGALDWARREWGRRYVMARHFTDNPASGEVLCKAGFLYTGEVALGPSRARPEPAPLRTLVWLA